MNKNAINSHNKPEVLKHKLFIFKGLYGLFALFVRAYLPIQNIFGAENQALMISRYK